MPTLSDSWTHIDGTGSEQEPEARGIRARASIVWRALESRSKRPWDHWPLWFLASPNASIIRQLFVGLFLLGLYFTFKKIALLVTALLLIVSALVWASLMGLGELTGLEMLARYDSLLLAGFALAIPFSQYRCQLLALAGCLALSILKGKFTGHYSRKFNLQHYHSRIRKCMNDYNAVHNRAPCSESIIHHEFGALSRRILRKWPHTSDVTKWCRHDAAKLAIEGEDKSLLAKKLLPLYLEAWALAKNVQSVEQVMESIDNCGTMLVLTVALTLWTVLKVADTETILQSLSAIVPAVSFLFGSTATNLFECVTFVLVIHPFDIGDVILLERDLKDEYEDLCSSGGYATYTVREMHILHTVLDRWDGMRVYMSNGDLSSKPVLNMRRSTHNMKLAVLYGAYSDSTLRSLRLVPMQSGQAAWVFGMAANVVGAIIKYDKAIEIVAAHEHNRTMLQSRLDMLQD